MFSKSMSYLMELQILVGTPNHMLEIGVIESIHEDLKGDDQDWHAIGF